MRLPPSAAMYAQIASLPGSAEAVKCSSRRHGSRPSAPRSVLQRWYVRLYMRREKALSVFQPFCFIRAAAGNAVGDTAVARPSLTAPRT